METYPFKITDEYEPQFLDDDCNDLYEFLVNHEHKPLGITMGSHTIPLPGIALLSPLWPPYPSEVRYPEWSLSKTLHSQLQAEYDRHLR